MPQPFCIFLNLRQSPLAPDMLKFKHHISYARFVASYAR